VITREQAIIRTTDPDDAPYLHALYIESPLRAALLDNKREPVLPTVTELRQTFTQKEARQGHFYTVEDAAGAVQGFCSLRGVTPDAGFGELTLTLADEAAYATPLADEALAFLFERAFVRLRLRKVLAHALENETPLRDFWLRHNFACDGRHREVVYARGRWYDLELFTIHRDAARGGA